MIKDIQYSAMLSSPLYEVASGFVCMSMSMCMCIPRRRRRVE